MLLCAVVEGGGRSRGFGLPLQYIARRETVQSSGVLNVVLKTLELTCPSRTLNTVIKGKNNRTASSRWNGNLHGRIEDRKGVPEKQV
jgi:hypothetical protein